MELVTEVGDKLHFKSMSAHEEISRLFEYQIIAISDDPAVSADDLLGTNIAVSMEVADGTKRWFHGIVASFGVEGVQGRYFTYRITARPWTWLLTRSADVRIFQDMSTPDIVKAVFGEYTSTFVDQLSGSYAPRTYCVQYRETDFNFVSRLMEEEGIFYFFKHAEDKHELVLADTSGAHEAVPGFENIRYLEDDVTVAEVQAINDWHMRHEIQTGKATLSDYNFETPSTDLKSTTAASSRSHGEAEHEVYDYPGLYAARDKGDARAAIRLDESASRFGRYTGSGNTPGLVAGARFTLFDHPRTDQDAEYLVLQTQIDMQQAGYEAVGTDDTLFLCRFVAQLYAEPFRPARTTRKPTVAGPQTALVVGSGDAGDFETDKYGRIKVQFHWDRLGEKNADSSCWLRVATPSAGNGWGMICLPRIGQEVVVAFLEGDPDQPLVVGSVYNAEQMPPYELPAHATVSTRKSRSKQGAANDFNELRFEDDPGSEYVLFHAQKDRLEFVEETLRAEIGIDEHRTVKGDRREKIEGVSHLTVLKEVRQKFDDKFSLKVTKDVLLDTQGQHSMKAVKDITAEAGKSYSIKAGTDLHIKAGKNVGVDGGMNVHIKAGMNVVIEGGMQLTIKAGAGSVVLGPDGVSITGPLVKVNSGGSPGSGSGASPVAPTAPE
ncbi:MAG: type VI secretion system tip protein VgrG, partial [Rubrivivax sp.]|nr:type VI secretion system tip protein VgrG [Rubrivivax sp.]